MKHIPHIEDLMFEGKLGFEKINRVFSLINERKFENFTIKIDGAPAVFVGTDPNDDQKFVAKKSIFNVKPIIYKTYDDIENHISNKELADIMKELLDVIPKLPGVYQGDFLFSKTHKKTLDYSKENCISFHPNTILYSIADHLDDYRALEFCRMGISFHSYYGMDPLYRLTQKEFVPIEIDGIYQLPIKLKEINQIEYIPSIQYIQPKNDTKYYNSFIRSNQDIPIYNEFDMLYHNLSNVKNIILKSIKSDVKKYLKTKDGLIETTDEGLVYSESDFKCKLVNRRDFSFANFNENYIKGWN